MPGAGRKIAPLPLNAKIVTYRKWIFFQKKYLSKVLSAVLSAILSLLKVN
jgi:hypothetical protein